MLETVILILIILNHNNIDNNKNTYEKVLYFFTQFSQASSIKLLMSLWSEAQSNGPTSVLPSSGALR